MVILESGQKVRAAYIDSKDKQCLKMGFNTRGQADKVIVKLKYGQLLNSYECPHCFMWHIGRSNKVVKQRSTAEFYEEIARKYKKQMAKLNTAINIIQRNEKRIRKAKHSLAFVVAKINKSTVRV